jgi:hypothetical protein
MMLSSVYVCDHIASLHALFGSTAMVLVESTRATLSAGGSIPSHDRIQAVRSAFQLERFLRTTLLTVDPHTREYLPRRLFSLKFSPSLQHDTTPRSAHTVSFGALQA